MTLQLNHLTPKTLSAIKSAFKKVRVNYMSIVRTHHNHLHHHAHHYGRRGSVPEIVMRELEAITE